MPDATALPADLRSSFAERPERHYGIVVKIAASYSRDPDDRRELAQEIAAQLWRAYPGYDPARPFSTWMYRIALNVAIGDLRGRRRRPPPLPLGELPDLADPSPAEPERERQVQALYRFIAR